MSLIARRNVLGGPAGAGVMKEHVRRFIQEPEGENSPGLSAEIVGLAVHPAR